jgi:ribA/ribD-fused uncharacterized protein
MKEINKFEGEHAFLSNFFFAPVVIDGMTFPTSENAFQAMKAESRADRVQFRELTPGQAKRLGRKIKMRSDWETIKIDIMKLIVVEKFDQNPGLRLALMKTGDANLVEGNDWNDTFWGVCHGVGKNHLGKILMEVRENLLSNV